MPLRWRFPTQLFQAPSAFLAKRRFALFAAATLTLVSYWPNGHANDLLSWTPLAIPPLEPPILSARTANRTYLRDYEDAVTAYTGLLLKAHTSNYIVQGFTSAVDAKDVTSLAKTRNIPLINGLGSGTLVDLARYGLKPEPTVQQALQDNTQVLSYG